MARLPRIPKGLRASLAREKRLADRKRKVEEKKKLIAKMKNERDALRKKRRGY